MAHPFSFAELVMCHRPISFSASGGTSSSSRCPDLPCKPPDHSQIAILEDEMHTIHGLQKPARMSMRRFLKARFQRDDDYCRMRVLDSVVIGGRTAYAAMEWVMKDNDRRQVVGVVLRLEPARTPGGKTIVAQEMIESMLPSHTECPYRILRLLSPTDDPNALEWRQRCRGRWRRRGAEAGQTGRRH